MSSIADNLCSCVLETGTVLTRILYGRNRFKICRRVLEYSTVPTLNSYMQITELLLTSSSGRQ